MKSTLPLLLAIFVSSIGFSQQNKALPNGDVYHLSFDNLNSGSYSHEELKNDFPIAYSKGFDRGSADTDRAFIDPNESVNPGGQSLRVRFPKGKLKTADSGCDLRIPLMNTFKDNFYNSKDLYLSYWVKFSDNFQFDKCGGKLPSLGGTTLNTPEMPRSERNQDAWKGRIMWRKGGSIQFYMEVPNGPDWSPTDEERFWGNKVKNGSGICEFEYQPYLASKGWHNIELHYKFESNGQNNGLFEGWVDGANYDVMNASVFNNYQNASRPNIVINRLLISAFLGGSDLNDYAPTEDIFAWFDEFRVSKTRINEYSKYAGTLSNANFESAANTNNIYPVPSKDGNFYLSKAADWEVYDLTGKKVRSGSGKAIQLQLQTTGMYIIQLNNKQIQKVVINKQ